MKHLLDWYRAHLDSGGYPLILLMMAAESTIIPIPSEVIIPFAALQAQATGRMTLWGVALTGIIGSCLGAAIMYWAARIAGRPLVVRYGPYFLIPETKLRDAENWSRRFGSFGVFIARLLPVVRHLIGIPMGIVKMDFRLYFTFTLLGSTIWCAILTYVGVKAGQDQKLMSGDLHRLTLWLLGFILIIASLYYFAVHRQMKKTPPAS